MEEHAPGSRSVRTPQQNRFKWLLERFRGSIKAPLRGQRGQALVEYMLILIIAFTFTHQVFFNEKFGFKGILQVDGYAGYRVLAERGDVQLAFCWACAPPLLRARRGRPRADRQRGARTHCSVAFAVGTLISERPPGHRRRSPASGSHRTWRADFPHHALRRLIHSCTARACSAR